MNQLDSLVEVLAQHKRVCFSFSAEGGTLLAVSIRECELYDFDEYGEEYAPGEMFEVGPVGPKHEIIGTSLAYANIQDAGNAVLRRRAERLGVPWGE